MATESDEIKTTIRNKLVEVFLCGATVILKRLIDRLKQRITFRWNGAPSSDMISYHNFYPIRESMAIFPQQT